MKIIKYKFLSCEVNRGTEEEPNIEQVILDAFIECKTQAGYDAIYPIAEKEAIPGTIEISGEFDPESSEPTPITWEDLDTAYNEGVNSL